MHPQPVAGLARPGGRASSPPGGLVTSPTFRLESDLLPPAPAAPRRWDQALVMASPQNHRSPYVTATPHPALRSDRPTDRMDMLMQRGTTAGGLAGGVRGRRGPCGLLVISHPRRETRLDSVSEDRSGLPPQGKPRQGMNVALGRGACHGRAPRPTWVGPWHDLSAAPQSRKVMPCWGRPRPVDGDARFRDSGRGVGIFPLVRVRVRVVSENRSAAPSRRSSHLNRA